MLFVISNKIEQERTNAFVTWKTLAAQLKQYSCKVENRSRKITLTGRMIWKQADGMTFLERELTNKQFEQQLMAF